MQNPKKINTLHITEILKACKKYGSKRKAASILGIPESSIRTRLKREGIVAGDIHKEYKNPLSENETKYKEEFTSQDCINELRRIAELDTTKIVSRNYFRNHSTISESTWNRWFGTFEEYKRAAGIKLSRTQHAMERNIAKHASVARYKQIGAERKEYANKYVKPNDKRYKTAIVCSDLHDKECDSFYLSTLIDTCKRIQPDVIVFGGDIFDLPEFSKYTVDPREFDVVGRIKFVHENILAPIRKACPNSQLDFIEGNHEYRLLRHLSDATPALKVVLSDLHGFTISSLLGLDKYKINYICKNDLSAYTKNDISKEVAKNYKVYWDCFAVHHFPEGKKLGLPGINGHHHKYNAVSLYNETYGSYNWIQLGSGHRREATYCDGQQWNMGFAVVHCDTENKLTNFEYIQISDFAVVGGKYYTR